MGLPDDPAFRSADRPSRRAARHDGERGAAPDASTRAASRDAARRDHRRSSTPRPSFLATVAALDDLASSGARVSVRVDDLDRDCVVLSGDEHVTLPVAGLGVVPLLIEVAAQIEDGTLDPLSIVERDSVDAVAVSGIWQHLKAPALPVIDLAVLAAATGDALATNALIDRVGLPAVRDRIDALGLSHTALIDAFRDRRGPDDAPQVALASTRELSQLFGALVNSRAVSARVSAQVAEWLSLNYDLSLTAAVTGLDPFAHDDDEHALLLVNKTGRARGIRSEAGVIAGTRAGVSYAMTVCFDDLSVLHRTRVHRAFQVFGTDLMEFVV